MTDAERKRFEELKASLAECREMVTSDGTAWTYVDFTDWYEALPAFDQRLFDMNVPAGRQG